MRSKKREKFGAFTATRNERLLYMPSPRRDPSTFMRSWLCETPTQRPCPISIYRAERNEPPDYTATRYTPVSVRAFGSSQILFLCEVPVLQACIPHERSTQRTTKILGSPGLWGRSFAWMLPHPLRANCFYSLGIPSWAPRAGISKPLPRNESHPPYRQTMIPGSIFKRHDHGVDAAIAPLGCRSELPGLPGLK